MLRFKDRDYSLAIEHYTAALRQNPNDAKVLSNLIEHWFTILSTNKFLCGEKGALKQSDCLPKDQSVGAEHSGEIP